MSNETTRIKDNDDNPSIVVKDVEINTYKDDLRIAAYIQRTEVTELRRKRQEYQNYKEQYKERMIRFLVSIFTQPLDTKFLDENNKPQQLFPKKLSVFEGIQSPQIPTLDQIRQILKDHHSSTRKNIFEVELSNVEEHEQLMRSRL